MDYASYRLGGDASLGVSSLVTVRLPGLGIGDVVVIKIDMAISINRILRLDEAARLLTDGLVLVTALVPEALAEVLPSEAGVRHAEVHLLAAMTDGMNRNRPNQLLQRLDLTSLGTPTRSVGPQLGFAAGISGPLAEHEAAEVVVDAFESMALGIGYLDPRSGVALLREELGLPQPP